MDAPITCKNCGHNFNGRFCNNCGEKVYTQKDKYLVSLFKKGFHFITHFEGTLLTSLKTLVLHPGRISFDYVNGIRKKYYKPLGFFLLIVIAYFLFPRFQGLNMVFDGYIETSSHAWYAIPAAKHIMLTHHLNAAELSNSYNDHSPVISRLALLLLIPMSALVLGVLFFSSRKLFFDHFILASELMSFYVLFSFVVMSLVTVIMERTIPDWHFFDQYSATWRLVFLYITAFMLFVFTVAAFKNFYKQPLWLSALKALGFIFVFGTLIIYVYRLLLYFLVLLFV